MGSPISGVLADHVIEVTEESVITVAIPPLKWCFFLSHAALDQMHTFPSLK